MKKWVRIIAIMLCGCLLISLCACGDLKEKAQKANRILASIDNNESVSVFSDYDTPGVVEGTYGDCYYFGMHFSRSVANMEFSEAIMITFADLVCETVNEEIVPLFRGTGIDTLIMLKTNSGEIYASIYNGVLTLEDS